jgi:hypothetical protein
VRKYEQLGYYLARTKRPVDTSFDEVANLVAGCHRRPTITVPGGPTTSITSKSKHGWAEVIFDGASVKGGIGPHLRRIKQVGQLVLRHGKAFSVRPI